VRFGCAYPRIEQHHSFTERLATCSKTQPNITPHDSQDGTDGWGAVHVHSTHTHSKAHTAHLKLLIGHVDARDVPAWSNDRCSDVAVASRAGAEIEHAETRAAPRGRDGAPAPVELGHDLVGDSDDRGGDSDGKIEREGERERESAHIPHVTYTQPTYLSRCHRQARGSLRTACCHPR
jgi:hypothetical protein